MEHLPRHGRRRGHHEGRHRGRRQRPLRPHGGAGSGPHGHGAGPDRRGRRHLAARRHARLRPRLRPGAPYWHELFTRDFGASLDFYSAAFGWDVSVVSDSDEFRYATLGADAAARAGVMDASSFLPEGVPAHWRVYFGVEDARAAAEVVAQLGGTVLSGPEDTPYGTIVTIQDPFGAQLLLASGYPAGR
ncbi:VOC family protein [Galactobacter valiniphilus]|uniref:VOC family protein n=1 Tax=Galactobacter valiniphilus TaxID=2676122 RepID=UPI001F287E4E|nr:VOC family protein [Galactobacter valiniphilus]